MKLSELRTLLMEAQCKYGDVQIRARQYGNVDKEGQKGYKVHWLAPPAGYYRQSSIPHINIVVDIPLP